MWKDWATNMAKIGRTTNFTKSYTWKEKSSNSRGTKIYDVFIANRQLIYKNSALQDI